LSQFQILSEGGEKLEKELTKIAFFVPVLTEKSVEVAPVWNARLW